MPVTHSLQPPQVGLWRDACARAPTPTCPTFQSISPYQRDISWLCQQHLCPKDLICVCFPSPGPSPKCHSAGGQPGKGAFGTRCDTTRGTSLLDSRKVSGHLIERCHCIPTARSGEAPRARQKVASYPWEGIAILMYCWLTCNFLDGLETKKTKYLKNKPDQGVKGERGSAVWWV